ncbi:hypothetical protein [uncultured Enterovirga sp.]|uniref:hypothetical protein n=1 Tax=uncultured Enterovirga sp. TaxID=2026352 RepID=UPI0035C9E66B
MTLGEHFDRAFYLEEYSDVAQTGMDPLEHYILAGWQEGRFPKPDFDSAYYLEANPDVVQGEVNPFYHYLTVGQKEGRRSLRPEPPLAGMREPTLAESIQTFFPEVWEALAGQVDCEHYKREYPDVAEAGMDPLAHYIAAGWREGRNPTKDFDSAYYLESNPDVQECGMNPFYHYIIVGRSEGRPSLAAEAVPASSPAQPIHDSAADVPDVVAEHFDRELYLTENPDVAEAGMDPLQHYVVTGWREGRHPISGFDPFYYLEAYPDVLVAGMEPFHHYLLAGRSEGRLATRPYGTVRALIADAHRRHKGPALPTLRAPKGVLGAEALIRILNLLIPRHRDQIVISVSHDEYIRVSGGVQNVVGHEQVSLNKVGISYLHLSPAEPSLRLAREIEDPSRAIVTVIVDGERVGRASGADLLAYLQQRENGQATLTLTIHSMLGHAPSFLQQLATHIKPERSFVWIHDFSTLCSSYALLRNDIEFCWAPAVGSTACQICAYGRERPEHVKAVADIFTSLSPTVLAPSDTARKFWVSVSPYLYRQAQVRPLGKPERVGVRAALPISDRKLRIAHIGAPIYLKGWEVFSSLVTERADDARYEFFLFSQEAPRRLGDVKHVTVSVTPDDAEAMVNALLDADIDVVVNWSLCYETFSYTAHEGILAGAYVIARENSGNIAAVVKGRRAGVVLQDEHKLFTLFSSGSVVAAVEEFRKAAVVTGRLEPSPTLPGFDRAS